MQDYQSAITPNHALGDFSTQCIDCHSVTAFSWGGSGFSHSIFPLTQGHAINECNQCHEAGNYSNVSSDCFACHQADYNATTNPNHLTADISNVCMECHSTMPGWKPADFTIHDAQFFPIFSGKHNNEWTSCTECHSNLANYSVFTCIDCHEHNRTKMDDKHSGEDDYEFTSMACLDCHPTGRHE
jgi:predicted CXXCH cytochrome family protein